MKFLGEGLQKLEHKQDNRQTGRRDQCITTAKLVLATYEEYDAGP